MPKLWTETIDTHRRQVNDAILDAAAELVAEHGPLSLAMSAIAERAGIGRATLYKYFPDIETILVAWHARDFGHHLERIKALSEADDVTLDDLANFVAHQRRHHPPRQGADVSTLAHALAGTNLGDAIEREIIAALTVVLTRLVQQKQVRNDHDPKLLARWLLHTAHAPGDLDDRAVATLVADSLTPRVTER